MQQQNKRGLPRMSGPRQEMLAKEVWDTVMKGAGQPSAPMYNQRAPGAYLSEYQKNFSPELPDPGPGHKQRSYSPPETKFRKNTEFTCPVQLRKNQD